MVGKNMGRFLTAAFLSALSLPAFAQAPPQSFSFNVTFAPVLGCKVTGVLLNGVNLPAAAPGPTIALNLPSNNAGTVIGNLTWTSDVPCTTPPAFSSTAAQFVIGGTASAPTLMIGPASLPLNVTVPFSGSAVQPVMLSGTGMATFPGQQIILGKH